ncbi:MAG: hypothetical protein IMF11_05680 [Proteobacteria bacterium]|nr:hypothetical protein [Pseudomonadota bacterium]
MISYDVVEQIKDTVGTLLSNYAKGIEAAMADEGTVTISLPVKIKQDGPKLDIEVGIGFVKERIRDAVGFTVDGQKELFSSGGVDMEVTVGDE